MAREEEMKILSDFEARLDPYKPEGGEFGCRIIDYGEVTVVLTLDAVPGKAFKRMSGYASRDEAVRYADSIPRYISMLAQRGVTSLPTECFVISGRTTVVYLVQPLVRRERIGSSIIRDAAGVEMERCIRLVLDAVSAMLSGNSGAAGGVEVAADSQMSNWYFPEEGGLFLIDIGSPMTRVGGKVSVFSEPIYRSLPVPIRNVVRMMKAVEKYFNDYFDLRLAMLDLLGNFVKEKAGKRIPEAIDIVNRWIEGMPAGSRIRPISGRDVSDYYGTDALLLELLLRVRRFNRFICDRVLRRRYDFILPGNIDRR